MKTTAIHFTRFKLAFLKWQKEFGCHDYRVTFSHEPLHNQFAAIRVDPENRIALVRFGTDLSKEDMNDFDPGAHGLHESLHLFLSRLSDLAQSRYATERQIQEAEEGMVRVLEKILTTT